MIPMPNIYPSAEVAQPVPNATEQELDRAPEGINTRAVMTFMPRGVNPVLPDFDPTQTLQALGPLTEHTLSAVMTLQATYERIRHLEAVVRSREERAEHWESECRALAEWKNVVARHGVHTVTLKVTATGDRDPYSGIPTTLEVQGAITNNGWGHDPSARERQGLYVLVRERAVGSTPETWPILLATAANDVLKLLGATPVPVGEDESISPVEFRTRATAALTARDEIEAKCRAAVGLTDLDDVTLLERLRELHPPAPKSKRRAR